MVKTLLVIWKQFTHATTDGEKRVVCVCSKTWQCQNKMEDSEKMGGNVNAFIYFSFSREMQYSLINRKVLTY